MAAPVSPSSDLRRLALQTHVLRSGRTVEYAFDGRCLPSDPFLFHFHALSMPGVPTYTSHKMYSKPALPETGAGSWASLPWNIVTMNRAGYGKSTMGDVKPEEWTYGHFAEDVAALADHLGVEKFAVFGGSSGGPYCIAAAALLPERVTAVLTLSGDANYCSETMPKGKKMNETLADGAPITYVDGTAMAHPGGACSEGSLLCGCCCATICPLGTKADLRVEVKKLGFAYSDISAETAVFLYHGDADDTTDVNCARFLKSVIPHAELVIVPGAGHVQLPSRTFLEAMDKLHAACLASAGAPFAIPTAAR